MTLRPSIRAAATACVLFVLLIPGVVAAQELQIECGEYEGVVCQGYFTDDAGVVSDPQRIEDALARVVEEHGSPVAVVVVSDSRGHNPRDFAVAIADDWGVGDPVDEDGVLVLVSLEERRIEVVTQDQIEVPGDTIAGSARSFFAAEDWEGGLSAIVGTLEQALAGTLQPSSGGESFSVPIGTILLGALVVIGVVVAISVVGSIRGDRRRRRRAERRRREALVDADLALLEPTGDELPRYEDYDQPSPDTPAVETQAAARVVDRINRGEPTEDDAILVSLWGNGLLLVIDREALTDATREPLELRTSQERPLLEASVQQAATDALAVDLSDEDRFRVRRADLQRVIHALRPHRVAAAVRRTGDGMLADLVPTPIGWVVVTERGRRFTETVPAFDPDAPLAESIAELEAASRTAAGKTARLEALYEQLPDSTARPAVAAALADIDDDPVNAVERYERIRTKLAAGETALIADGLDTAGIAALLLMNNNGDNVAEFLTAYQRLRDRGTSAQEAVEYALAGLLSDADVGEVRRVSRDLGLPVAVTAALLRRRDDGPAVYKKLRDELAGEVSGDSARTIAGVLAISLEPTQTMRRWLEAREALHGLGLRGSYADVAAAFGASDPRGPRKFALAYAAQRQALADSTIDDADRFAPELAHEGTSNQEDTWDRGRIPGSIYSFDPYTFFFYHWVVTRGVGGSYGWEPVYADRSWSQDRSSWWGGGGGFGSSGGSSWGGSSWSGGSFGGFGGGGGFSGGGGGGGGGW